MLFGYHAAAHWETIKNITDEILCFSPTGRVKWRFVPGRPKLADNDGEQYFPPYFIAGIKLLMGRNPGEQRIVVSSFHHMEPPDQVAVLNGRGKLVGEYWHPGWLQYPGSGDLDHSGREKLLLAGVNNGQHSVTLIVFDPDRVHGAATRLEEQAPHHPGGRRSKRRIPPIR